MENLRKLSTLEQSQLEARGCRATAWEDVWVDPSFSTTQLTDTRLEGHIEIGRDAYITNSYVCNYSIGEGTHIEDVTRLECRKESSFGDGVEVATINENGGRSVKIFRGLKAQTAYLWAINRHRTKMVQRLEEMVEECSASRRSAIARIGERCRIIGAKFIREVEIEDDVTVDGASMLECGTILSGGYIGVDVKAREFIVAEDAHIDTGAMIERCFVGESVIMGSGYSALDSLIFASSHLENGEAASIFAAPFTVSHHKSSLLIAGLFSFFNAGSGSNQSNHLFKSGAVHQAIHPRGCKFASGSYIMSPAQEGAFTMVKGHHPHHHDTSAFPFSYLIEDDKGRSLLIPAVNLVSYGTRRDVDKWPARDRRRVRRDVINFEEYNPYLTGAMVRGVNTLHSLSERFHDSEEYVWERALIKRGQLQRGITLYNKAIAASIGSMLARGGRTLEGDISVSGRWVDIAGAYLPLQMVEQVMEGIERGELKLESIDRAFAEFAQRYDDYAHQWAYDLLGQLLGGEPRDEDVASAIEGGRRSAEELERQIEVDRERDSSLQMAIGYGLDFEDEAIRESDYRNVRGI